MILFMVENRFRLSKFRPLPLYLGLIRFELFILLYAYCFIMNHMAEVTFDYVKTARVEHFLIIILLDFA